MRRLVTIQVAMKEEGLGLAQKLGLQESSALDADFGFRRFDGKFGQNLDLVLVLQGTDPRYEVEQIGLEAAAVCATLIIHEFKPDLMINFGTAGGFESRGWRVGDACVISEPIVFHDRRVSIPGYRESQVGAYPTSDTSGLRAALSLRPATVSSGSSLEMSDRDHEMLISQNADVKEMECAAIAWVAHRKRVPFLAMKSVTDLVDHPEPVADQFLKNLALASHVIQDRVVDALNYLDTHLDDAIWNSYKRY